MFGGKRFETIEARLNTLEEDVSTLRRTIRAEMEQALARVEEDPAKRLALLVAGIESALGERVAALEPRIADTERTLERADQVLAPVRATSRHSPAYGVEHVAEQTGLLGLWFAGGWNDVITIIVNGHTVAHVNNVNDLCSSFAVVIRRGERYKLDSRAFAKRQETGWKTVFTPFGP